MTLRKRIGMAMVVASLCATPALVSPAAAATAPDITFSPDADLVYSEPSASGNCRPITFDSARVVTNPVTGGRTLVVKGYAPYAGTTVRLDPVVYFRQPEFWRINVIGCPPEVGATVMTPYTTRLEITGRMGTEGIEVAGSDRVQRIRLRAANSVWDRVKKLVATVS